MSQKRRDSPCPRCGWEYEGFHICFDASKVVPGEKGIVKKQAPVSEVRSRSAKERWDDYHAANADRDNSIVSDYKAGLTTTQLRAKYELSYATIVKVIKRAETKTGTRIMRPRGVNARWSKETKNAN